MKTMPLDAKKRVRLAAWLGVAVFLCAWERVQATRLSFKLEQVRREVLEAKSRNSYLRLALQRLSSPDVLAAASRARLGMAPPKADALIVLGRPAAPPKSSGPTLLSWLKP